ncbi:MAG: HDOD domain-containing protein [Terracidiphilus sp.]|jgi:putative nucleotidyltransferase with HDIG domain
MLQVEERRKEAITPSWAHLRIPPFPQVALRVLQLANNENVQLHELSSLISSDPAFASEVLTIANSLLYAPRFPASSILQAIAVLGANNLQGLCLTVGVRGYMGKALNQPAMRAIWRHNLACALIADQLASVGFLDRDVAFTAGVMHDIGRLALAVIRPKEYSLLLGAHSGSAASILNAERDLFGWDHCEAGRQLIEEWKMPPEFEPIVAEHHAARSMEGPWRMAELINVSCRMADTVGCAAFPGCEAALFTDLLDELPERERRLFHATVETLANEIARKIDSVESVRL